MIHFIRAGESGAVKIGYAIEPWKRLKELQTGSHVPLAILRVVPGDRRRGKEIHKLMTAYKIRGEWYHPVPALFGLINSLGAADFEVIGLRAYAVLRRDTEEAETDPCPFCGRRHRHGKGDGHRVAHCVSPGVKEEVSAGSSMAVRQADGYIIRTRWKRR